MANLTNKIIQKELIKEKKAKRFAEPDNAERKLKIHSMSKEDLDKELDKEFQNEDKQWYYYIKAERRARK